MRRYFDHVLKEALAAYTKDESVTDFVAQHSDCISLLVDTDDLMQCIDLDDSDLKFSKNLIGQLCDASVFCVAALQDKQDKLKKDVIKDAVDEYLETKWGDAVPFSLAQKFEVLEKSVAAGEMNEKDIDRRAA